MEQDVTAKIYFSELLVNNLFLTDLISFLSHNLRITFIAFGDKLF